MKRELPDVQAGFRKARGTRDQIATFAGSWKKQESSRKTSISALLTMPKPLTVWITINCGKFWKRWEYHHNWVTELNWNVVVCQTGYVTWLNVTLSISEHNWNQILNREGFPHSSVGKEASCNAGDCGSIPGSGRSVGEGIGYPLQYSRWRIPFTI